MKYLSSEPFSVGMPRNFAIAKTILIDAKGGEISAREIPCDHLTKKHIYARGVWKCECGARLKEK